MKLAMILVNLLLLYVLINETIVFTWSCRYCGKHDQGSVSKYLFKFCDHRRVE